MAPRFNPEDLFPKDTPDLAGETTIQVVVKTELSDEDQRQINMAVAMFGLAVTKELTEHRNLLAAIQHASRLLSATLVQFAEKSHDLKLFAGAFADETGIAKSVIATVAKRMNIDLRDLADKMDAAVDPNQN